MQEVTTGLQLHTTRGEENILPGFIGLAPLLSWEDTHETPRPRDINLPPHMMEIIRVPNGSRLEGESIYAAPQEGTF